MITETRVFSRADRLRMAQRMKKMSKRLAVARARAMKRTPTKDVLFQRAFKTVKKQRMSKLAQGANVQDLSVGQKQLISTKIAKMLPMLKKLALKLVSKKRQLDTSRKKGSE